MQTLSSARRTCMASASAVECTATVAMPTSLQARSTRNAISPRLAIKPLSNIAARRLRALLDNDKRLAELHRMAIADEDGRDGASLRSRNVVHGLHGFDYEDRLALGHAGPDVDEGGCARLRCQVRRANHGRLHATRMLAGVVGGGRRRRAQGGGDGWAHPRGGGPGLLPGHSHPEALTFDLDLAEPRLLQQGGELPDQVLIGTAFAFRLLRHASCRNRWSVCRCPHSLAFVRHFLAAMTRRCRQ